MDNPAAPQESDFERLRGRVRILSAFARTAPGRLPQYVQDALGDWEDPDAVFARALSTEQKEDTGAKTP
jgi:hypothetical protein